MKNYYHGTSKKYNLSFLDSPSSIDKERGGGEIGKGFYTTNDPWIAKSWAIARYGEDYATVFEISFEGEEKRLMRLSPRLINTIDEVIGIWIGLKRTRSTYTFTFGDDIIDAPFATIESSRQYKFESQKAQDTLNNYSVITQIF